MNNLAHEHVVCSAYYAVSSSCFDRNDQALRKKNWEVGAEMLKRALEYTKEAGIKRETVEARFGMAADAMKAKLDNDCGNISLLLREHALSCKTLAENPEKRVEELVNQALGIRPQKPR